MLYAFIEDKPDGTGEIVGTLTAQEGMRYVETSEEKDPEQWYYDGVALVQRPAQTNAWDKTLVDANGVDLITMAGLAPATEVRVEAQDGSIDPIEIPVINGTAQIGFTQEGLFDVSVVEWPKQKLTTVITVEDLS